MQISIHPHILQFKQPAGTSRGVYKTRKVWYITLTGEQLFGIGECAPLPALSCDDVPEYEEVLRQACAYAEKTEEIPYEMLQNFPSILFGLETAFLSARGYQRTGNPYQLFSNAFSEGREGIVINGLVWMGSFEEMLARMEEKLALGFRCVKIKIGAIDWDREIALIRTLRQHYPREVVELRVDANGGFAPEIALERLKELAKYDIHSIEQPIRQGQWNEMARLCRETPIPIALDEELIGVNDPQDKAHLLDTIRPQYIILKPSLHGGLKGSDEWIRLAEERHIGYWATSALESNVGLNAISQWCYEHNVTMPQGLGTGQLFVENYEAIHLEIKGDRIWRGTEKDRRFWQSYRNFCCDWKSESPLITVHTSGSTGKPQPITVEKRRMMASAAMTLKFLGLQPGDKALLCMPLDFIAGKMMVVRALTGGLTLRLVAPTLHPLADFVGTKTNMTADVTKTNMTADETNNNVTAVNSNPTTSDSIIAELLPDFLAVTPMQALATLEVPEERALFCKIPKIIIGGGSISAALHTALQDCQGEVFSTYGMTETLSHIAMRRLNGPEQSEDYRPLPGVKVSLGPDDCLRIEAPALCPAPLQTHDIANINIRGEFRILGRKDNIICSGGIKLSLEQLEAKLEGLGCPFQLTAVPDELLGEALTLIYSAETAPDFEAFRSQLGKYEFPKHFLRVPQLPLTETGKPARSEARKIAQQMMAQELSDD